MEKKILVWDAPTRVFHWLLAASFAGAYLTAESERWRDVHVMLGYTLAGLIAFRLVWGFVGSRHARFADFAFGPGRIVAYLKLLLSRTPDHYLGHNPAGALAIFLMLGLGVLIVASGIATFYELGGEAFEEVHEVVANAMLAVVFIHVAGVVVSSVLHRENLVRAMVTGCKRGEEPGPAPRRFRVVAALLAAAVAAWLGFGSVSAEGGDGGQVSVTSTRGQHDD